MQYMAIVECVLFALLFSIRASADVSETVDYILMDGFVTTMWFSLILLGIAMVCTLAVKNKIVKKG